MRATTDAGGAVKATYAYDPYGRRTVLSGHADDSVFGYTGHYVHSATGLALAPYRAYDAEIGRWLSRDPIGEEGGINLYGYVENSSINLVDPLGLYSSVEEAGKAGACAINPQSKADNQEHSGAIYSNEPGDYQYSPPLPGGQTQSPTTGFNIPKGAKIVGYYHTHGAYTPGLIDPIDLVDRNTHFSYVRAYPLPKGDIPFSDYENKPNIMADPLDNVHEYIPNNYDPSAPRKDRQKQRQGIPLGSCSCK